MKKTSILMIIATIALMVAAPVFAGWGDSGITFGTNGEKIDASTDKEIKIVYDDVSTTLGTFGLKSTAVYTGRANDDKFIINLIEAKNSANEDTVYATIEANAVNYTNGVEAGSVLVKMMVDGTNTTIGTFSSTGLVIAGNVTADNLSTTTDTAAGDWTVTSNATVTLKATLNGETECNEDVDINLNASDEEISIAQSAEAGPGDAGLMVIDDNRTGATAAETDEATITIDAEGTYAIGVLDGSIGVDDGEVVIDSKYSVVGQDGTTAMMVLAESVTSTSSTLQTNAFATTFGTAPVVTVAYTEDPGSAEAPWIVSVASNQVVVTTIADKNYSYIAVGSRP